MTTIHARQIQLTKQYTIFWNDSKAKSKDSGRARFVFSFRFNAYACNLLCRQTAGHRPQHGLQARTVAHMVYEVFVNVTAVRKIDVSDKYNSLKVRLGATNETCGLRACNTREPQF